MFMQPRDRKEEQDAIIVENVSKHFKIPHERRRTLLDNMVGLLEGKKQSYEEFYALKNISFRVKKGETLGIIGENGSGKSTLLKIIAGVLQPDTGSVKVNGKIAPFLELGVGFQPELSAEENVRLYGAVMGMSRRQIEEKFEEIFEFAELERFKEMKLKNFSSGMYMRLAFAAAIATEPDIYLIDEVLAVGDEAFQRKCFKKMEEFQKDGKSILFVSHGMDLVKRLCKRSLLFEKGKLIGNTYSDYVVEKYYAKVSSKEKKIERETKVEIKQEIKKEEKQKESLERFGSMASEIEKVEILNENYDPVASIKESEDLIIRLHIKFNKDFEKPVFGIRIMNRERINVYNTATKWQNIDCGNFRRRDRVIVDFKQKIDLLSGKYVIDCAITYYDLKEFADIQFNVATFNVETSKEVLGIVDLKSEISIKKLDNT